MARTQTTPLAAAQADHRVGLDISIRTGVGSGGTLLSAFDAALQGAGVADFNLVTLSSVIPTGSTVRHVASRLPGGHGDLLFCVRAEAFSDQPGQTAWAGLGWCTDDTGGGLFVEHHGPTEQDVLDQIATSLHDMNTNRGGGYGTVHTATASAVCTGPPVCALVLAAYRVSTWHGDVPGSGPDGGGDEVAAEPAARANGRVNGHPARTMIGATPHLPQHPAATLTAVSTSEPGPHEPPLVATSGPHAPSVRVSMEKEVDFATARRYWDLYRATFGELETEAVARQLLHESEFMEEMLDPRVRKYVAWNEEGQAIGLSTLTACLETVPWISPAYFAHHYPEQTARNAVYYLGFSLVDAAHRGDRTFRAMITPMINLIIADRGVVAVDMCAANQDRGLFGNGAQYLKQVTGVTIEEIDRQTYYTAMLVTPAPNGVAPDGARAARPD